MNGVRPCLQTPSRFDLPETAVGRASVSGYRSIRANISKPRVSQMGHLRPAWTTSPIRPRPHPGSVGRRSRAASPR
jgi:hypothetical protein